MNKKFNDLSAYLESYKGILNKRMYIYLYELINLKYSALTPIVNENDIEHLKDLKVYNEIFKYNLYNRTLILLEKSLNNYPYRIITDSNNINCLYNENNVFNLDLANNTINMYNYSNDDNRKEECMLYVLDEIARLKNIKNPYNSKLYGGPAFNFSSTINEKIKTLESIYDSLTNSSYKNDLIEPTNYIYNKLLDEYGLLNSNFDVDVPQTNNSYKKLCLKNDINIYNNTIFY